MKYLTILFFAIISLFTKAPEPKIILNGTVKDKTSKEALVVCDVKIRYTKTGITVQTLADAKGKFKMTLDPGEFTITYNYVGYKTLVKSYKIFPKKDTILEIMTFMTAKPVVKGPSKDLKEKGEAIHDDVSKPGSPTYTYTTPSTSSSKKLAMASGKYTSPGTIDIGYKTSRRGLSAEGISDEGIYGKRVKYESGGIASDIKAGTLTAGEINDFSKWVLWNDLSKGELKQFVSHWGILPKHRFGIQITNDAKKPLADIQVVLKDPLGNIVWKSRTDNTGKAELWANLFDSTDLKKGKYSLEAIHNGEVYKVKNATAFHQSLNKLVIPSECKQPLNMDIVFAVDATGSMGDEISYLQAELADVIEKVKQRNPYMGINMGSVFYRDKEDAYLTVQQDLTSDISKVMTFMKAQSADGGGDEPEAVDAAMEVAIGKFHWREEARSRVMFLVLDASPHHEKEVLDKIRKYTQLAAEKGIRIVPVVCSGIDKASEYLLRSIALATNGNYIFLTDHSGIGDGHIAPSTDKYDVETLNVLLIRLLQQYIYMPTCDNVVNTSQIDSLQKANLDSTHLDSSFVKNVNNSKDSLGKVNPESWFLKYYPNPCRGILQVDILAKVSELFITDINGKLLMRIEVGKEENHIEIDMREYPAGIYFLRYSVDGNSKSGKFVLMH